MTLLYEAVVGSTLYGTAFTGSDRDLVRVYVDTPAATLAVDSEVGERGHHLVGGVGDLDVQSYSLRRFASLVLKGNANIVSALCATEYAGDQADAVRTLLSTIHCQSTVRAFVGMALAQIRKFESGSLATASRAHLIEEYGYDTKFLYHVYRLDEEVHQFVETGYIRYPLRAVSGFLVEVRQGLIPLKDVPDVLSDLTESLRRSEARAEAELRPDPDVARVNRIVLGIYEKSWRLDEGTLTDPVY